MVNEEGRTSARVKPKVPAWSDNVSNGDLEKRVASHGEPFDCGKADMCHTPVAIQPSMSTSKVHRNEEATRR